MEDAYPKTVRAFLRQHKLRIKVPQEEEAIVHELCLRFDAIVFNVVSLAGIVARLHGKTRVEEGHLEGAKAYLQQACVNPVRPAGSMSGGAVMAAEYYEAGNDPAYNPANAGGTATSVVDFAAGVAHGGLGPDLSTPWAASGGAASYLKYTSAPVWERHIRKVLRHHELTASAHAMEGLLKMILGHVGCLGADLARKLPLTLHKTKERLALKKHAAFH